MNLLPLKEQASLRKEYYARLAAVILFAAAALSLIGAVSLVPAYVLLFAHKESGEAEVVALQKSLDSQDSAIVAEFSAVKKEIAILSAKGGESDAMADVSLALLKKAGNSGISVTSISYEKRGSEGTLSLGGKAGDRPSLRAFQKALEGEYRFEKVRSRFQFCERSRNSIYNRDCLKK